MPCPYFRTVMVSITFCGRISFGQSMTKAFKKEPNHVRITIRIRITILLKSIQIVL